MSEIEIVATILTILFWSGSGLVAKRLSVLLGRYKTAIIVVAVGIIPVIAYHFLAHTSLSIGYADAALSAVGGLFLAGGLILVYKTLETEQVTNTVALSETQPALLVLFGLLVLGESLNLYEALSMLVIFGGVFFIITTEKLKINKRLIPAVVANVLFTGYWILMDYAVTGSGHIIAPLLISRVVGVVVIAAYIFAVPGFRPAQTSKTKKQLKGANIQLLVVVLALLVGFFDGGGDIAFSQVLLSNFLAFGSALTALVPMVIALFAYFLYGDRLTKLQLAGLAVMVIGAIALGFLTG